MAGQNPGSPTDFQYFYEDEVYKINNRGQVVFGLVLENYEANSSDQESDIETPIQKGEIRVVWHPSGTERVISEKSVGLADRSLMPGDVVRRLIAGKDTQRGYCRDIVMTAALQIVGTKHVIPSVASERLQPLEEFTPDLAVCLDSWVGTSKAVHSKLRLVSADGSRLEYPDLDSCPLEDYSMRRRRSTPYSSSEFYPGQVVYGPLGTLDSANWLHVTKEMKAARKHKMHDHKFTVEAVVTESVSVHWQCRALSTLITDSNAPQQPKFLVEGEELKNLKLLNVFEPCTLQVGDRNFLTILPEDTFVSKKQWRKHQSKYYRNLRKQSRPVKKPSKTDANSTEHIPSRPKKRASSHRKLKSTDNEMEVDGGDEKLESLDEALKADLNCPSIKIEPSADVTMPVGSSQEDTATEEKNDSGISGLSKSHVRSPEPCREDGALLNGDSKAGDSCLNDDDSDNWENTSSDGSDTDRSIIFFLRQLALVPTVKNKIGRPHLTAVNVIQTLEKRAKLAGGSGLSVSLFLLGNSPSEETTPEVGNSGTMVVLSSSGVPRLLEPRVAAHIERGRVAMRRLEEMFAKHPTLQSQEIMRKLLNLYKDCRFLDRLMGTTFFHEDHFLGLLERVRERGASTPRAGERRVHEQLARLFTPTESSEGATGTSGETGDVRDTGEQDAALDAMLVDDDKTRDHRQTIITANVTVEAMDVESNSPKKPLHLNIEPVQSGSGAVVSENTSAENVCGEAGAGAESEAEGGARNVCYKLCSLIHAQLVKAHAEVSRRRPQELAEFLNSLMKNSNASEEKLPYHFSVQYGALVVSMADQEEKGQPKAAPDAKDNTAATAASAPFSDDKNVLSAEAAPLATAEVEAETGSGAVPEVVAEAEGGEGFCVLESAPAAHRFRLSMLQPSEPRSFYSAVKREIKLLKSDLPPGVWVRGFEDRIDLLSVMIAGPSRTPYEGGLFVFDVQLGGEYPRAPPLCHYHSYCSDRLNPNLYEDGKVCVSLLGTWSGRGVEVWGKDSSLLQVIVSLQGLILNAEPYFNEAGYEKQKGTQQGKENSRMYNEMVLLKLVQSMTRMVVSPPEPDIYCKTFAWEIDSDGIE
ncbi:PREDICTED: E2/E3 hybrid ubiquitin-protein ligase UBE2O [Papilio polytes]|uniref:E2/E3 hybrid ubiquitin-protein ligase UBE2O n=1 Tax=Papilio polytes TaxID=76194 RepID=UPI0006763BC6|nr:PREDICTED: E2/E3 hybrid ubiquitin-protein ligase UBE2O [Papilio polytes]